MASKQTGIPSVFPRCLLPWIMIATLALLHAAEVKQIELKVQQFREKRDYNIVTAFIQSYHADSEAVTYFVEQILGIDASDKMVYLLYDKLSYYNLFETILNSIFYNSKIKIDINKFESQLFNALLYVNNMDILANELIERIFRYDVKFPYYSKYLFQAVEQNGSHKIFDKLSSITNFSYEKKVIELVIHNYAGDFNKCYSILSEDSFVAHYKSISSGEAHGDYKKGIFDYLIKNIAFIIYKLYMNGEYGKYLGVERFYDDIISIPELYVVNSYYYTKKYDELYTLFSTNNIAVMRYNPIACELLFYSNEYMRLRESYNNTGDPHYYLISLLELDERDAFKNRIEKLPEGDRNYYGILEAVYDSDVKGFFKKVVTSYKYDVKREDIIMYENITTDGFTNYDYFFAFDRKRLSYAKDLKAFYEEHKGRLENVLYDYSVISLCEYYYNIFDVASLAKVFRLHLVDMKKNALKEKMMYLYGTALIQSGNSEGYDFLKKILYNNPKTFYRYQILKYVE
ncbi:hypothetical protein ACFL6D_00230 [Spirochaetota bacterium]